MLVNIIEVIVGLILLIWGADRFVHGAAATARNLGVAPLMIGLTIVAFATSAPEILVSIVAALRGEPDLAVGNAIGSNMTNVGLVLGAVVELDAFGTSWVNPPIHSSSQCNRMRLRGMSTRKANSRRSS